MLGYRLPEHLPLDPAPPGSPRACASGCPAAAALVLAAHPRRRLLNVDVRIFAHVDDNDLARVLPSLRGPVALAKLRGPRVPWHKARHRTWRIDYTHSLILARKDDVQTRTDVIDGLGRLVSKRPATFSEVSDLQ